MQDPYEEEVANRLGPGSAPANNKSRESLRGLEHILGAAAGRARRANGGDLPAAECLAGGYSVLSSGFHRTAYSAPAWTQVVSH